MNSWSAQADGSPEAPTGFEGTAGGGADPSVIAAGIGGTVSLVNTAEYAGPLAAGHSPQAPAGWVNACANLYDDHIRRYVAQERGKSA